MGGVWCKADRVQTPTYVHKESITSTISRWTDHMRHVYKKPKQTHRPPRTPEHTGRGNGRLTISHPQLLAEHSSDGWRTATLVVPQTPPVPPPRKKRRRAQQESVRAARSVDELTVPLDELRGSTFSLPERYLYDAAMSIKESPSTLLVTPILESRVEDGSVKSEDKENGHNRQSCPEQIGTNTSRESAAICVAEDDDHIVQEESKEDLDLEDFDDEILSVEKDLIYSSRTVLHSNLGCIDKLSVISEVSVESGFDDRIDAGKSSERCESVTSCESFERESDLNTASNTCTRERTATSKREWLENILKESHIPPNETDRKDLEGTNGGMEVADVSEQLPSPATGHLHLMNLGTDTSAVDARANNSSPPNHSVLLQAHRESTSEPRIQHGESIFLTNTKTNIIYKSLSSDTLGDKYLAEPLNTDTTTRSKPTANLGTTNNNMITLITITGDQKDDTSIDGSFKPNTILNTDNNSKSAPPFNDSELPTRNKMMTVILTDKCNGYTDTSTDISNEHVSTSFYNGVLLSVNGTNAKGSAASSRRSSLSDSLHEFELSIYDMLKEKDSSDEEISINTLKSVISN